MMKDNNTYNLECFKRFFMMVYTAILFCSQVMWPIYATSSYASDLPDIYESDDTVESAGTFYLFSTDNQIHNFHSTGDEDWIKFYTFKEFGAVEIKTYNPEENCETIITLFDSDKTTQLKERRFTLVSGVNLLSFKPEKDGIYYARIKNKEASNYGDKTGYMLSVYLPIAPNSGTIDGIVTDNLTGLPLEDVYINVEKNFSSATTYSDGFYFFQCPSGEFTLYASKNGYLDYSSDIDVHEIERTELNFSLSIASETICKASIIGYDISGAQEVNNPITFTVNATNNCSQTLYYRFSMNPYYGTDDYDDTHWKSMTSQEWISSNSIHYTFTEAGKYIIVVWAAHDTMNVDPNGVPIAGWAVDIE